MTEQESFYRHVGEQIRRRRKELRMPQDTLATDVGLTRASISNIEKGRQKLLAHTLCEIARTLKVDPGSLLPAQTELLTLPTQKDIPREVLAFMKSAIGVNPKQR
jgi:transcriptional regulator with XRE-family HTH domain